VTSRAQKRHAKRKRRPAAVPLSSARLLDLPRPLRLVGENATNLARYVRLADGDLLAASVAALDDAIKSARRITELAEPFDAFDVLECVQLNQALVNPETYRETEHEGSAAVIELTALILSCRGHRGGTRPDEDGHRARPDHAIDEVLAIGRSALAAGSMAAMLNALANHGAQGSIPLGAVLREVFVRNLSYDHMVIDTLGAIFDVPWLEEACRSVIGCTVREIRVVFAALESLHERAWGARFNSLGNFLELARTEAARAAADREYGVSPEVNTEALALWAQAWADPGDASTWSTDAIAQECGLAHAVVKAVLGLFSVDMSERAVEDPVRGFFEGRSPFRTVPILRDPAGSSVVVHGGLLVPAIRERVEDQLEGAAVWPRYVKHRADHVEREALRLLQPHFPTCVVHSNLKYFVPNPKAVRPQTVPTDYTKLVEGDGLLVVDDVALIVEAKAGSITELTRTGDNQRLESDLRKLVTKAAEQAERLRERIDADHGLRLRDGSWLDLSQVREIHSIAVSLEDLSGIATVTSELVRAGLLTTPHLPWTVSLHDLRIVTELVARPAEFLLYIRRRTEPEVTSRFHAVDELDFFLEFYAGRLYVEPDPEVVRAERPLFGEPTVAVKRRFNGQGLTFITSRTDQLDAWYFHERGIRQSPADKPRLKANPELCALVDAIAALRGPGWLRIGTTLLDGSGAVQRSFARYARDPVDLSRSDGRPHTMCVAGGSRADDSWVLVWASTDPRGRPSQTVSRLGEYVSAKKHQVQAALGAGLLFDSTDVSTPLLTHFDNRVPSNDDQLDALVKMFNLRPVDRRLNVMIPTPGRRGRTTPRKG
jgi:hypothetical protein